MKLSAFLAISLPIVAMAQLPALATDQSDDTSSWLKNSVASLSTKKPARSAAKVSHSSPIRAASSAAPMRLRPFVPNRFLPRESDLHRNMVAEQAQLDPSAEESVASARSLNGRVSAYTGGSRPASIYDQYAMQPQNNSLDAIALSVAHKIASAKKSLGNRAPRLTPGQNPMIPEQLRQNAMIPSSVPEPPAMKNLPMAIPAPLQMMAKQFMGKQMQQAMRPQQMQMSMPMQQMQQQQMSMQQMPQMQQMQQYQQMQQMQMQQQMQQMAMQQQQSQQMQQMRQLGQMQQPMQQRAMSMADLQSFCQREGCTAQQQQELMRLMEQNQPTSRMDMNGDIVGNGYDNPSNGQGQPPLPMNFMASGGGPMGALQASRRPANVQQARFGSWHDRSQLPESGFHSYLSFHKPNMLDLRAGHSPTGARTVRSGNPSGRTNNAKNYRKQPGYVAVAPKQVAPRSSGKVSASKSLLAQAKSPSNTFTASYGGYARGAY